MSLLKRLRPLALGLMLSAATIPIFSGCTTITTPWKETGRELVSSRLPDRKIETEKARETARKKTFDISDLIAKDNAYFAQVSNSLFETNYQIKDISKIRQLEEVINEKKETKSFENDMATMIFGPIVLGILGVLPGTWVAKQISGRKPDEDTPEYEQFQKNLITGGIISGVLSLGLGIYLDVNHVKNKKPQIETRQIKTGTIKEGTLIYERTDKSFSDEGWAYQNQPAEGIDVKLSLGGAEKYVTTDENGELNLSRILGEWAFFPNQFASRQQLEKIVRETSIVSQIKSQTLDVLLSELINGVQRYDAPLIISTEEKSTQQQKVENASRTFMIGNYNLGDLYVREVVSNFINREINPSIKTLRFFVRDELTRIPINGANFEFTTDAPSKSELAGRYFTGELKEFAEKVILDYLSGSVIIPNCSGKPGFSVYYPSNMFVEVTHPEYNYVSGEVDIGKYLTKPVPVEMADLGKKVRVQNSKESLGKIGE